MKMQLSILLGMNSVLLVGLSAHSQVTSPLSLARMVCAAAGPSENSERRLDPHASGKVSTPNPRCRLSPGHSSSLLAIGFSADGRELWTGYGDGTVMRWETATGMPLRTFHVGTIEPADQFVFSPDGRHVLIDTEDKTLILREVGTGKQLRTFQTNSKWVDVMTFSQNGRQILYADTPDSITATTAKPWQVVLVDLATGERLRTVNVESSYVNPARLSPDGRQLLAGMGHKLVLWDTATGQQLRTLRHYSTSVNCVAFGPDGRKLLAGSSLNTLTLWDVDTGKKLQTFWKHEGKVKCLAFSPDGRLAFSGGGHWSSQAKGTIGTVFGPGEAILWDAASAKKLHNLSGHPGMVMCATFSPDGKRIVTGNALGSALIWDVATGQLIASLIGLRKGRDFLVGTPQGYFHGSPGVSKLFTACWFGNEKVTFERYARKYHRPDLVARALRGLPICDESEKPGNGASQE